MALHFSLSFSITFKYGHSIPIQWQFICMRSNENRHAYAEIESTAGEASDPDSIEHHIQRFMVVDCLGRTAQA